MNTKEKVLARLLNDGNITLEELVLLAKEEIRYIDKPVQYYSNPTYQYLTLPGTTNPYQCTWPTTCQYPENTVFSNTNNI